MPASESNRVEFRLNEPSYLEALDGGAQASGVSRNVYARRLLEQVLAARGVTDAEGRGPQSSGISTRELEELRAMVRDSLLFIAGLVPLSEESYQRISERLHERFEL
tara:strand:+ start:202 stop:522 length:321 start_codon:yes stop_codon:yes gene_type:complete